MQFIQVHLNKNKSKTTLIVSPIIVVFATIIGVAIGSVYIPPSSIVSVILNKLFGMKLSDTVEVTSISIIWQLRLPRVLLAFLVGASLSASGAVVQSVLRNPLASPFTLGVSSGASLGAGLVFALNLSIPLLGGFTLPTAGLIFGLLTVYISIAFATKIDKNLESTTIVLCGMVLSMFINAIFLLVTSGFSGDKIQQLIRWQMGSFSAKGWDYIKMLFPILIISLAILLFFSKEMDILTFGEEQASSMGVETKKVKWILLVISSILTGCAVAFAGVIGFIDLIAPHIVRRIFSSKHRYVVILSAIFGGVFMVFADLISRTIISPRELPVGAVTALIGAPFFAYIYFKRRHK